MEISRKRYKVKRIQSNERSCEIPETHDLTADVPMDEPVQFPPIDIYGTV